MTIKAMTARILTAQLFLAIWNPDLWQMCQNAWLRKKMRLLYKARGIVLHDRALNGEYEGVEL